MKYLLILSINCWYNNLITYKGTFFLIYKYSINLKILFLKLGLLFKK